MRRRDGMRNKSECGSGHLRTSQLFRSDLVEGLGGPVNWFCPEFGSTLVCRAPFRASRRQPRMARPVPGSARLSPRRRRRRRRGQKCARSFCAFLSLSFSARGWKPRERKGGAARHRRFHSARSLGPTKKVWVVIQCHFLPRKWTKNGPQNDPELTFTNFLFQSRAKP